MVNKNVAVGRETNYVNELRNRGGRETKSIARIQQAYEIAEHMGKTLIVAYSGGKDSDVLLDLAIKSGVKFRAEHNHTTADAPETVYHIRAVFERLTEQGIPCKVNFPPDITDINGKTVRASMWNLIPKKQMPPTRLARYCCEYFKERHFEGQHMLFGVRREESNQRKKRGLYENLTKKKEDRIIYFDENDDKRKLTEICHMRNRVATNPIIDWTDEEIWDYIKQNRITINPLYAQGFKRVGCIGCPMAGKGRLKEFIRYPKYRAMYINAFEKMLNYIEKRRRETGKCHNPGAWKDGKSVFMWWTEPNYNPNQISIEDLEKDMRGRQ